MITIETSALAKALALCAPILDKNVKIPSMGCLLIEAADGQVAITGTNGDQWMTVRLTVGGMMNERERFLVEGAKLAGLVARLPAGSEVRMDTAVKPGHVRVMWVDDKRSGVNLQTMPIEDYPQGFMVDGDPVQIDAAAWRDGLERTKACVSTEETRYYLNGICAAQKGDCVELVATDGHRLAAVMIPEPVDTPRRERVIIPTAAVSVMIRMLEGASGATMAISGTIIRVDVQAPLSAVFTSRMIDGTFPDYERVIPPASGRILRVNVEAFKAGLNRAAAVQTDGKDGVTIRPDAEDETLTELCAGQNYDAPEFIERVPAERIEGPCSVKLRGSYVMDALATCGSDTVDIHTTDGASPVLFLPTGGAMVRAVVMPTR